MAPTPTWITPFMKQAFVTSGVALNLGGHGLSMGFAAILLPQLRLPDSIIPIDDTSGSWIASILGFALIAGNFLVSALMGRYGRKLANIVSVSSMLCGWLFIIFAKNIEVLLIARIFQGISMGMSASMGPVLTGEYTSPKNRGAFLMSLSIAIATGVLLAHSVGSYTTWQTTAVVIFVIVCINFLIVLYSPESPSWLAEQGRYDECREVYHWLRGTSEDDELERMIESSVIMKESRAEVKIDESCMKKTQRGIAYFNVTITKREFYKPIFIMVHIYTLSQWAGANILASYTVDVFKNVIGSTDNIPIMIISMDIQRIISNICAVIVIKKVKRRTMLLITVCINISALLLTAAYSYSRQRGILPFEHPVVGCLLIHMHMFSIATGTVPLPFTLAGELFPLEYRSLAGVISVLFLSSALFITVKSFPYFLATLGLHGAYCIYAGIVGYCLIVAWIFLPETKDRTLQDIEDEFRGKPLTVEQVMSLQSLTSLKKYHSDRRCSSPVI